MTSPDGIQFKVTPTQVSQAGQACLDTEATITGTLGELKTFVYNVESFYKGVTATAFLDLMNRWDVQARNLASALDSIGVNLKASADTYAAQETENLSNVTNLSANL